eukprot:529296-Prymnesium_polylepis.1
MAVPGQQQKMRVDSWLLSQKISHSPEQPRGDSTVVLQDERAPIAALHRLAQRSHVRQIDCDVVRRHPPYERAVLAERCELATPLQLASQDAVDKLVIVDASGGQLPAHVLLAHPGHREHQDGYARAVGRRHQSTSLLFRLAFRRGL